MEMERACPTCGQLLPNDAPEGFCPCCSFGGALLAHKEETRARLAQAGQAVPNPPLGVGLASATRLRYFGDYELLGEIGRGGMGVVYRARQLSLNRLVAVKMLLHSRFSDEVFVKRFHTEAEAAAHLDHPQIVPIYEVGEHEGQHYFSMKLIEGRGLDQELTGSPLPPKRAARLVATMARAVHYAHQRGVLHRDLKPHNILLDAQGEPHLTDFGLAKLLEQDTGLTVSEAVMGSPAYMAPEQAAGKTKHLTTAADVYSLGAVLYALATGKPPFVGRTSLETMRQVVEREPVRPQVLNPALDRDLETICLKSLAKEPDRRYGSAGALAEDLERWLRNEPITARRVSGPDRMWLWCRRNPRLALATGAALLSLIIGMAGVTWQWRRAESERARAEAEAVLTRRHAYAAEMKEVQRALEDSDLGRARKLLDWHRPGGKSEIDLRGWEWRYLWARCRSDERFTLCQYSNSVSALAFSADGQWLAVRREDGAVALWDATTKRLLSEPPAHTRVGRWCNKALAFSPLEPLLAWGNTDATGAPVLSLRDLGEQKEIARLLHAADVVFGGLRTRRQGSGHPGLQGDRVRLGPRVATGGDQLPHAAA
ncbi:MAG: WD40 repeat domain-containing serine/threonine protein kinase [Verrucomicrobiia bacterium]